MFEFPNPKTIDPKERRTQRILEIIPGALTWATFLGMIIFSFWLPVWVAVFVVVFDIYWIFRTIFISSYSIAGYRKLKEGKQIDWWEKCRNVKPEGDVLNWKDIVHVVMLPTAGEEAEVIGPAIQSVADANFPNGQIIILLATEEREAPEHRLKKVKYLKNKFAGTFRDFIVTTHIVSAGEIKCKASNATFAAKELMKYLSERQIDFKKVIFSNFDCDTVAHPQYFAALTYAYITEPKRLQMAFQPLPMYHNNLWDTNAFVRVIVTGSSFWHIFQSTRPEYMVTFSSHSEPFDTLVKVNFWPVNMISEDSIIYWKCFAYFNGDYRVKPIYLPVSLDAVLAESYWKTIVNQYKQKRRWAYGIENFPVIMRAIGPNKKISLARKVRVAFEMLEGHHSWATAPFILAILGWLPLIVGGDVFGQSVLAHNLPLMTRNLMNLAMLGLIISVSLSFLLMPPRPKKYSKWRNIYMVLQWVLVPISAPFLGAMPAIESQTRLMLGKYFGEFWVTEKVRKK